MMGGDEEIPVSQLENIKLLACKLTGMSKTALTMELPYPSRQFLSSRRGLFEGLRTYATEMTVAPGTVVEHFNIIEDIRPGHVPGFIYSLSDTFFF